MSKPLNSLMDTCLSTLGGLASNTLTRLILLFCLCSVYVITGVEKLLDIPKAIAEVRGFGVPFAVPATIVTIAVELGGSAMVISGRQRWLGALLLAIFTFLVNFVANRFWYGPSLHRDLVEDAFLEHVGLVAAFLLVAWYDAKLISLRKVYPAANGIGLR